MTVSEAPEISVVLAFRGDGAAIRRCLQSLSDDSVRCETIVVHDAARPWLDPPAGVRLVSCDAGDAGRMRAAGIAAATAPLVALTRDDARPAEGWLRHFVAGHRRDDAAAIGGPVLAAPGAGPVALAAWLSEYSRFASPKPDDDAPDLAATNVCYKRAALPLDEIARDGYRELQVHAALRRAGRRLRYDPSRPVFLDNRVRMLQFVRDRFRESRTFGRTRAAASSSRDRTVLRFGSVFLPGIFLGRTIARACRSGCLLDLIRSLPVVVLFHCVAAAGETAGYWSPQSPRSRAQ